MPKKNKESSGGYDTPEDGFLWKPVADNGGLVILLPSKYRGSQVTLLGPDGKVIEQGRSTGYANGDREHFRFGQDGGNYPDGTIVQVTTSDGQTMQYQVGSTSSRWDVGGSGGGEGGGMTASGAAAAFGGSSNLNIQRPNVSERLGNVKQPSFEAPLSTLETIRSVSDIITGSAKSYDSIMKLAEGEDAEDEVLEEEQPGEELTPIPDWSRGGMSPRNITAWPDFSDFVEKKLEDATPEQLEDLEKERKPWHS